MRTPSRGGEEILGIKWNSSSVVHVLCDALASCIVDIIEFPPSVISVTTICWHRRRSRRRTRRQPKPGFFLLLPSFLWKSNGRLCLTSSPHLILYRRNWGGGVGVGNVKDSPTDYKYRTSRSFPLVISLLGVETRRRWSILRRVDRTSGGHSEELFSLLIFHLVLFRPHETEEDDVFIPLPIPRGGRQRWS